MATHNICRFPSAPAKEYSLHVMHFVLETDPAIAREERVETVYKLYYAVQGTAVYSLDGECRRVQAGDLFFGFPSSTYFLRGNEGFQYMYLGFLGEKALFLMEKLHISRRNFHFPGMEALLPLWTRGVRTTEEMIGACGEGVLLCTLSLLGDRILQKAEEPRDAAELIRGYIDSHYCEEDMTLSRVGQALSFSPKYVSAVFRRAYRTGFTEYLTSLRVRHAKVLMERGVCGVGDVARMCGFSDPAYFSRVFRQAVGCSPAAYKAGTKA